ncbi:hypothetical protein [Nonomuraea zeae]|uniref:Uncharacterized protein n=1 Tax=Nonomuraea zeae TaxID=1642303 RepID=A0A5S4HJS3_9ACTN|nr:hypothetical protein [Nonomuraea zeae]TMR39890.1 hypothetical protein ETD85_00495 [Nonomuraea zeae]
MIERGRHGVGSILEGDKVYGDAYAPRATGSFAHLDLPVGCAPSNSAFVFVSLDQAPDGGSPAK